MWFKKKNTVSDIEKYYDDWTDRYIAEGRELIEAFRTKNDDEILEYYIQAAQLKDGQTILDAGCGVCGPAAFFAQKLDVIIDAVTISQVQIERSIQNLQNKKLIGKISLHKQDFHYLHQHFSSEFYDRILFIESLGHTNNLKLTIDSVYKLLKKDGCIYIKDFFVKESSDVAFQNKCNEVVKNINRIYAYNTLDLNVTISTLRRAGFEIIKIIKPTFVDDTSVRLAFETTNEINIFGKYQPFVPTDWLEIFCRKA